ncbi:MAG: 2-oxo acid dehydrogenase subunit E2, partial [Chloroflexota bacterium]|nr:2-oxo acid dehydrogenase subunit E2 [Chloroflexota bacterium]
MATTIKMPQLGESVTEGTIERWLVKEGDTVEQYDPLFEVVTDKVNAEVPAEIAGTVSKILVPDGETVAVGTPVAEIDSDGAAAAAPPAETEAEPAAPEAAADAGPTAVQEQESAPAAAEEAPEEEPQPDPEPQPKAVAEAEPKEPATQSSADGNESGARMTPAVRRLVREHEIDVAKLKGTGAGGRVTRDDVLSFIDKGPQAAAAQPEAATASSASEAPAAGSDALSAPAEPTKPKAAAPPPAPAPAPAASAGDTEMPLSQMRKGIARKMTQVKQTVPHAYTVVEVDMTSVVRWREANNTAFKAREGASLSYVAVVVKAVTETLRKHPNLNSQFADDRII